MNRRPSLANESGAILVQVAVSLLMLMGFTVFVVDYGILWVARGQAQNAADAGALAGAVARAWDDETDPPPVDGIVDLSARNVAQANLVWNVSAVAVTSFDCPPGVVGGGCIRVDVFRNGEAGSQPIGMFFGGVLGISTHGVRATATAQVRAANATDCLKPFAILDKEPVGYTLAGDYGTELEIKFDTWPGSSSFYGFVDVGQGMGASSNWDATRRCLGTVYGIGDDLPQQPGTIASIWQGFLPPNGLIATDPTAWWDSDSQTIRDSCVETRTCRKFNESGTLVANPNAAVSPRIIPLAVADRDVWLNDSIVRIKGFLGFFVTDATRPPAEKAVYGVLVTRPGILSAAAGTPDADDEFTRVVVLVR